jgi:outer membrane receptor protein involved in Fe transport
VDPYGVDVAGNDLPFAPSTTWSLGAQLEGPLGRGLRYRARAEHLRVGRFFYDAGNREAESYALTHVRLGVQGPRWRFDLWVRNAFDEAYVPVAFQPNPVDPSLFVGENGAPRTFGFTFSLDL